jgi:hypothetical protein
MLLICIGLTFRLQSRKRLSICFREKYLLPEISFLRLAKQSIKKYKMRIIEQMILSILPLEFAGALLVKGEISIEVWLNAL